MAPALLIALLIVFGIVLFCVCKNGILPWCRTAKRREILSKKKYKKLTADPGKSVVTTYDEIDEDDDEDLRIKAENKMILKRVEYSSQELEQLKLLDAAIDEDDILDSDSLNFPENDTLNVTDNDEYMSLEEATSVILNTDSQGKISHDGNTEDSQLYTTTSTANTSETVSAIAHDHDNNKAAAGEAKNSLNQQSGQTVIDMQNKTAINKKD